MNTNAPAAALALALAALPVLPAQSLTTLYARNNGGSMGGAVYFDVTILNPNGIIVTSLETNTAETAPLTLEVYTNPFGYAGSESSTTNWTLVARGEGTGQGINTPTPVDVEDFFLPPGTVGVALVLSSTAGHDYTNGTGANQSYANSDLRIDLGSATNQPFTGSPFSPRVWNGTIYYSGLGNGVASSGVFGEGCNGSNGIPPSLSGIPPRIGQQFTATMTDLPAMTAAPAGILLTSPGKAGPVAIGRTGCNLLLASPLLDTAVVNMGGMSTFSVTVPSDMALLDGRFYNQVVMLDNAANALGLSFSNGHEATIGM